MTAAPAVSPKQQQLDRLTQPGGWPVLEYDESLTAPRALLKQLDIDRLRAERWLPLSKDGDCAQVVVCDPDDQALLEHIRATLGVARLELRLATCADVVRLIENSADLNPDFPVSGGRTPLARVRTYLAVLRTDYAAQRTQFARSRTGLALARTGMAFVGIAVAFLRFFGYDPGLLIFELLLLAAGVAALVDGLRWYLPARRVADTIKPYPPYELPAGYTALEVHDPGGALEFSRSRVVESAQALRQAWDALSSVERRRFLANDRTTLAEERTILAYLRTLMAKARTGLAFTRTGVVFAGIGIGFIRKFPPGPWSVFDWTLIVIGALMLLEGFYWYWPGRRAGHEAREVVARANGRKGLWDIIFPSRCLYAAGLDFLREAYAPQARPGVFATTGLALERTTLADKRNAMSHLRTVLARGRTGMAFIRTGFSLLSVGAGLLVYFNFFERSSLGWSAFDFTLMGIGLYLIADGLHWYIGAERLKRRFPYCSADFDITEPDYSRPKPSWKTIRHCHDDD